MRSEELLPSKNTSLGFYCKSQKDSCYTNLDTSDPWKPQRAFFFPLSTAGGLQWNCKGLSPTRLQEQHSGQGTRLQSMGMTVYIVLTQYRRHHGEQDRQVGQIKGPSGSVSHPWQRSVADAQGKMVKTRDAESDPVGMGQYDRDPTLGSKSITETLKSPP